MDDTIWANTRIDALLTEWTIGVIFKNHLFLWQTVTEASKNKQRKNAVKYNKVCEMFLSFFCERLRMFMYISTFCHLKQDSK